MDVLEMIRREVEGSITRLSDAIAAGSAQDFAAYKQLVGRRESLILTLDYINELEQRLTAD